jgi:hypothetical protein
MAKPAELDAKLTCETFDDLAIGGHGGDTERPQATHTRKPSSSTR